MKFKNPNKTEGTGTGYTYIFSDGDLIKIGSSADPTKRLRELKTGNPKIFMIAVFPGGLEREKLLHQIFREQKKRFDGEWFDLEFEDLQKITICGDYAPFDAAKNILLEAIAGRIEALREAAQLALATGQHRHVALKIARQLIIMGEPLIIESPKGPYPFRRNIGSDMFHWSDSKQQSLLMINPLRIELDWSCNLRARFAADCLERCEQYSNKTLIEPSSIRQTVDRLRNELLKENNTKSNQIISNIVNKNHPPLHSSLALREAMELATDLRLSLGQAPKSPASLTKSLNNAIKKSEQIVRDLQDRAQKEMNQGLVYEATEFFIDAIKAAYQKETHYEIPDKVAEGIGRLQGDEIMRHELIWQRKRLEQYLLGEVNLNTKSGQNLSLFGD